RSVPWSRVGGEGQCLRRVEEGSRGPTFRGFDAEQFVHPIVGGALGLFQKIKVEKTTRQAILRWDRLPRGGESVILVELRRVELDTCSVTTTEDELLILPPSGRGRR